MRIIEPVVDHLHLACGLTTPENWLNVDGSLQIVLARYPILKKLLVRSRLVPRSQAEIPWSANVLRLNLARRLPFADGCFLAVYCSHLLEHLYYCEASALLKECHRILRIGGVCRFVVPDLESLVRRYLSAKADGIPGSGTRFMESMLVHEKERRHGLLGAFYRLTAFHQHKWMYDTESLTALFRQAGFSNAKRVGFLESRIDRVAEVEKAGRVLDGEGIIVEASKE